MWPHDSGRPARRWSRGPSLLRRWDVRHAADQVPSPIPSGYIVGPEPLLRTDAPAGVGSIARRPDDDELPPAGSPEGCPTDTASRFPESGSTVNHHRASASMIDSTVAQVATPTVSSRV